MTGVNTIARPAAPYMIYELSVRTEPRINGLFFKTYIKKIKKMAGDA